MLAPISRREETEGGMVWPTWCYTGEGGGGTPRRCVRDVASPAQAHAASPARAHAASPARAHAPAPAPAPPASSIKVERFSPHESTASRSRSVTPSTSSYPGTPTERGSPNHAATLYALSNRSCSEIIRTLAAKHNAHPSNEYFHGVNGINIDARATVQAKNASETPMGGLFAKLANQQGGSPQIPAFPVMLDMTSTKTLFTISRAGRAGRSRRKRFGTGTVPEHFPLDLSAAGESSSKRARLSASSSTPSDDGRDRISNEDRRDSRECLCAEARARISAWSVDDVADFVSSIDICAEYNSNFREQRIDGAGLPLLTEDHLTGMLQMKLGPALKLRAVLARRLEPCAACQANNLLTPHSTPNTPKLNGVLKPEPRSNTTSPS